MLDEKTLERIHRLKVAVADLSDGSFQLHLKTRVTNPSLRPAVPMSRIIGTAVTVREYVGQGERDYTQQILDVYELGRSVPYAVLVIRNEVPDFTCMGSGGSRVARAHGYVGCIVDGPIRDTQEMPEVGFPLFGTSVRPGSIRVDQTPPGTSIHFEIGKPIQVAGATISPGDVIVADNDGAIAIEPNDLEAVITEAEKIVRLEARLFNLLDSGKTFRQILSSEREFNSLASAGPPEGGKK